MKKISQIALDLILYFYNLERNSEINFSNAVLSFNYTVINNSYLYKFDVDCISELNLVKEDLFKISNNSDKDLYTSLKFIIDEDLIQFKNLNDSGGERYRDIRLTSKAIKYIEGFEDPEYKKVIENHFHISLAETIKLESLFKAELGDLKLNLFEKLF